MVTLYRIYEMNRIPNARYAEVIGEGLRRLPRGLVARLGHVQFLCGTDPVFAGLHPYANLTDGRSFKDTAHCAYPYHLLSGDKVTTIVLPVPESPHNVVHELGHALHETIDFDTHWIKPVTKYAKTNQHEAFAEALVAYTHYGNYDRVDDQTVQLFKDLSNTGVLL